MKSKTVHLSHHFQMTLTGHIFTNVHRNVIIFRLLITHSQIPITLDTNNASDIKFVPTFRIHTSYNLPQSLPVFWLMHPLVYAPQVVSVVSGFSPPQSIAPPPHEAEKPNPHPPEVLHLHNTSQLGQHITQSHPKQSPPLHR